MTPQVAPHLLGRSGEDEAAAWYAAHGYEVLARNWRCRTGELDLAEHDQAALGHDEVELTRPAAPVAGEHLVAVGGVPRGSLVLAAPTEEMGSDLGRHRSLAGSSSTFTSLNVTTRTDETNRAGRYMSQTHASPRVISK